MGDSNLADPCSHTEVEKLYFLLLLLFQERAYLDKLGKTKDALSIDNSLAAHISWRKQYKQACEGSLAMVTSCPTK